MDDDRFGLMQRDDDYQRYLIIRNQLMKERSSTEDYQELVQFALSLTAEEREAIAKEAIATLMEDEDQ